MAGRALDRAFSKAQGAVSSHFAAQDAAAAGGTSSGPSEEQLLREEKAPMSAKDAIQRILLANDDKDYFRLLQLPHPTVDALGRPVWHGTDSDVSKAYRRLALIVHPDKNPGDDARRAFEALKTAQSSLRDKGKMEEVLRNAGERARREASRREAECSLDERIQLNSSKNQEAKLLRKGVGDDFQREIMEQVRRRQAEAKRKQPNSSRNRREDDKDGGNPLAHADNNSGSDYEEQRQQRLAKAKKRKKPSFI